MVKTIKLGAQEWADANLNVVHFRNGDEIKKAKEFIEAMTDLPPHN